MYNNEIEQNHPHKEGDDKEEREILEQTKDSKVK
jgi:hypothetical protein